MTDDKCKKCGLPQTGHERDGSQLCWCSDVDCETCEDHHFVCRLTGKCPCETPTCAHTTGDWIPCPDCRKDVIEDQEFRDAMMRIPPVALGGYNLDVANTIIRYIRGK